MILPVRDATVAASDVGFMTGIPEISTRVKINLRNILFVSNFLSVVQVQSVLSCLATSSHVHIIASIDHINAPLSKPA